MAEPAAPLLVDPAVAATAAGTGDPAAVDRERFTVTGSLRTRAARGTVLNTAFTVGLGGLTLLRGSCSRRS